MDLVRVDSCSFVLEHIPDPGLDTRPQGEFDQQLLYQTSVNREPQLLRNKEHMRLLLASIDERMEWVTFIFQDRYEFSQAAYTGNGVLVVEVNTVPLKYADRILKSDSSGVGDISSPNFGNMDALMEQEQHTPAEAFAICCSWMEHGFLPEGYIKAPAEE